jgi:hypothetical protein
MKNKSSFLSIISWLFGILFSFIGIVNIFWGNDMLFGVFILSLSFIYYPPVHDLIKKITGYSIPILLKIILALFMLWASLGVGELLLKIKLMLESF